ncbi:transcriptional regulator, LacI family [Plantibacter flavus]|uniref:LacI family transcriptional regulator n=1 Tax=Plantibacter flavus TaxID=150123 RepID=A0A3N2C891_9MICO|nr:LacI family DNA-binding transcriptional regulator [Plantibacter flavus]ROR83687.1 LacI family transcriptional regulator [Plantibacter flavus]SMG26309.1 transcriptional regulator, LacI family [Plantibacter flavus]
MTATLTDVARHAGVSIATASRAFGEPDRLADATLERVLTAAADLGYSNPNGSTAEKTFGVIVPDIASPVYATLLKGVHAQAWQGRHRPVLFDTDEDLHREHEQLELARKLNGMLLCSPRLPDDEIRALVGDTPVVVVNRIIDGLPYVVMDTESGPRQAVEHLAALGHRHIAYAAGPKHSWADLRRGDAVAAACAQLDIEFTRLGHQAASIQGGLAAAATIVASGATAVIAYNDLVALGIDAGITSMGKRCPEDLSIIGTDDIEMASIRQPGLTTVRLAINRCGSLAVEVLLQAMAGGSPRSVASLDSQLIVRDSTAPPRRG